MVSIDAGPGVRPSRPIYFNLTFQVLIAIILGVLVGVLAPHTAQDFKPLSDFFIKLVKLVIAPVIFLTIVTGVAHVGDMSKVGRIGGKALIYFELVTTFALGFGLLMVNLMGPGHGASHAAANMAADIAKIQKDSEKLNTVDFLLGMVPDNVIGAFAKGDLIPVLIFALLFGAAISKMGDRASQLNNILAQVSQIFFNIISYIMVLAPIGAFGGMAYAIGKFGPEILGNLALLMASVYATMALFICLCLGGISWIYGFNIFRFLAYIKDELLIVLGTSSSESALPRIMEKLQRFGVAKPVVGLVIPTGYSFNLDGTSIYMSMATIFIAQAYGVELSIEKQIGILLILMVTSKGAAGVTGSGFTTLAATLASLQVVPIEGLGLLIGVDRFMSEARAITNLIGNAVATVVIAKSEKAFDETMAIDEYRREFNNPKIGSL